MDSSNAQTNPKKLFVGNLPYGVTEERLRDMFSDYGDISDLKLLTDRDSGRSRGIAFVEYQQKESADEAIQALNETEIDGRNIQVNIAKPPRDRNAGARSFGQRRGSFGNNRGSGGGGYGRQRDFGRMGGRSKQRSSR